MIMKMDFIARLSMDAASLMWSKSLRSSFFGPKIVSDNGEKSFNKTHKFSPAGFLPPFILHVLKDSIPVDSMNFKCELWLNGELLLGPSEFNRSIRDYEIRIDLLDRNELEVRVLKSSGPFALTIWIDGQRLPFLI